MRLVRDDEVRAAADPAEAAAAVADAFAGPAALQPRHRIVADGTKLSTMAAILPGQGLAGAKVYTTVGGAFRFVVLLFDAATGAPLACMEADAFTEIRTAAVTEVAAAALGPAAPRRLALFGTGVQARAHGRALARRFALQAIDVVSRGDASAFCDALAAATGVPAQPATADAVAQADLVVTATRARTPLFDGTLLRPGAFVAAVGSTLPETAELDLAAYRGAATVIVEDEGQSFAESGGLIRARAAGALPRVMTLADALADPAAARPAPDATVVFDSVGIALEDVAVAGAIWRRLAG
jgi:ornithine cyclodeaminase